MKIILADDHEIVLSGLKMILEASPLIEKVTATDNGHEVIRLIQGLEQFDLIITDLHMPKMGGLALIEQVKALRPGLPVVVLSMHEDTHTVKQAFELGTSAYLLKGCPQEELLLAIQYVSRGQQYICAPLAVKFLRSYINALPRHLQNSSIEFSGRELEVLELMANGQTNSEISEQLFLSRRTVEGHRQNLLTKTGSKNTASLIKFAVLSGLIE